ncbi:MAG: aminotransferase class V-fold PLP-dependent enzyme [Sandaracinaceae bacterium]
MIYLNHAATSWPKPAPVREAVAEALSASAEDWDEALADQHRRIAAFFGVQEPEHLLLTPGCTASLAVAVADLPWQAGDRVAISSYEHHALVRPVLALEARGVEVDVVPDAGSDGPFDLGHLDEVLREGHVRLVAVSGASNVTGALLPLAEIRDRAHAAGAQLLVDAAQLAGWTDLDAPALGADLVAFGGHKALQGPWGVGGLIGGKDVALRSRRLPAGEPEPLGYCDTGSVDRAAVAGLAAAVGWLSRRPDRLTAARTQLDRLEAGLRAVRGVHLHGATPVYRRVPTVCLTAEGWTAAALARALRARGVLAGAGLQCAPLAHRTLGTSPDGALRLSLGPPPPDYAIHRVIAELAQILAV